MYHGISAYNKTSQDINSIINRISEAQKNQCCWSDIPIGPIGIFSDPDNLLIYAGYETDCFSCYSERFGRYSNQMDEIDILPDESNYSFFNRVKNINPDKYSEFFAEGAADAIWVADETWLRVAEQVSNFLGLPLITNY